MFSFKYLARLTRRERIVPGIKLFFLLQTYAHINHQSVFSKHDIPRSEPDYSDIIASIHIRFSCKLTTFIEFYI